MFCLRRFCKDFPPLQQSVNVRQGANGGVRFLAGDPNTWSDWATVYAAIVATGAAALELRRWFESGAKLSVGYMLNGVSHPPDEKKYIVVNVTNRGDTATTITHLVLLEYRSAWQRYRRKAEKTYVIVRPIAGKPLPHLLDVGTLWVGMAIQIPELNQLIDSNTLWAEVYTTHQERPARVHLRRRPNPSGEAI